MRPRLMIAFVLLVVAVVAVSTASALQGGAAKAKLLKIKAPAAGKFSVSAISITPSGKAKPKLRVVGKLPSNLVVAAGVVPDKKHKGRYVGFVVTGNKKAKALRQTQGASDVLVITIEVDGADADSLVGLTVAIDEAEDGATLTITATFLANPPGGVMPLEFLDAGLAAQTGDPFGSFSGGPAGQGFLGGILGGGPASPPTPPPPPPTAASCTTALVNQGTLNEVISNTQCQGATFNGLLFTPNGSNKIADYFPEKGQAQCSPMGPGIYCLFPNPVSSSGPIDLRTSGAPNGFSIQRSTDGGKTWVSGSWSSTGP